MNNYEKRNKELRLSMKKVSNYYCSNDKRGSNSLRSALRTKNTRQIIPCSVKPISCIIPRDVCLKEIFIQLFNSSFLLYNDEKIYTKLSDEIIIERKKIIESIKNFIILHKVKYKILYNIIYMFDILICYNNRKNLIQNLEHLGLGSSILVIKFIYEENRMLSLNIFKSFYNNKYYTINELQEIEIKCLKLMDYYMNFPTPLSFMELLFLNGIVFSTDNLKNEISLKIYNMTLLTLEKIILLSNEYIKYNPLYLCCCIVAYCREYYGIEKWPKILSKVFDVNENHFDNIDKEFFPKYNYQNHHYAKSSINIIEKIINKKIYKNKYINNTKEKEKKEYIENNEEKNNNDININHINKDIIINQENKLIQEYNKNYNYNNLKDNNNNYNIKVNYKTSQEIRNSALFRKMSTKYNNKKIFKNKNESNNSNTNNNIIKLKNEFITTIVNEKKNNQLIYDLNKYKSINSTKKPLINIFKTPLKFGFEDNSSCFYKPNNKNIEYNYHQRKKSTITISIKNNNMYEYIPHNENKRNITINQNEEIDINSNINNDINNNIDSDINNNINNNQSIGKYKRDAIKYIKKVNNKTIDDIKSKINLNEKEEIKVKVKNFYENDSNDKERQKRKKYYFNNKSISTEDNNKNINKKIINDNNKFNNNNNSCVTITGQLNIWKTIGTSINENENNNNELNIPSKKEFNYLKENKNENKNINRNSSCNDKYITTYNKEDDYSNETTSDNSHNFSIRRNYFKLKKLRDKSINTNNGNIVLNNNNKNNKSISAIKFSGNNNIESNNNGIRTTNFRDCLKIGFDSIDRRIQKTNNEKEILKDKEKEKDNYKYLIHPNRYSDIRSFYKMKNCNKNNKENEDLNEINNREKNDNINHNFIFQ